MRRFPLLTLTCLLWLLPACASPHLTPPPPAPASSYTGSYLGSAADNLGRTDIEMVLVQADDALTGEVILTFAVGLARYSAMGKVTGQVNGESLELNLTPDDRDYCPYRASMTRSGAFLEGSYVGVGCIGDIEGTLSVRKQ